MEYNISTNPDELIAALGDKISTDPDTLTHWGIKGMKWGVRRYQNADGSLTAAGEKRRAKLEAKLKKLEGGGDGDGGGSSGGKGGSKGSTVEAPRKKTISEMDDSELTKALNRARMEDEYRQRRPEQTVEKKPSFANKFVSEALAPAIVSAGKQFAQTALTKLGENLLKGKPDPNSIEGMTAVRDRLKLQNEIDEYKMGGKINWDNMLKKQQYDKNKSS